MTDTKDNPKSGRLEFQIKELKEENKILREALELEKLQSKTLFDENLAVHFHLRAREQKIKALSKVEGDREKE